MSAIESLTVKREGCEPLVLTGIDEWEALSGGSGVAVWFNDGSTRVIYGVTEVFDLMAPASSHVHHFFPGRPDCWAADCPSRA